MGEEGGRRKCHSSSAGDEGRRRRHPSNSTSKPTQPSKSSSSASAAAQNAPKDNAQKTAAAQGKKNGSSAGGKKESVNKWSPSLVWVGVREKTRSNSRSAFGSFHLQTVSLTSVWARVDLIWFLICAFHLNAGESRQSFHLCAWLLITFTKTTKKKKCIPCIALWSARCWTVLVRNLLDCDSDLPNLDTPQVVFCALVWFTWRKNPFLFGGFSFIFTVVSNWQTSGFFFFFLLITTIKLRSEMMKLWRTKSPEAAASPHLDEFNSDS